MKSLTITLYMLGAILILPQQVCSMEIEQSDPTQHSNTPPTNQTTSRHPTSELPNTPADIITRLENAVGNNWNNELNAKLINLELNHLQFLELAFNAFSQDIDKTRQKETDNFLRRVLKYNISNPQLLPTIYHNLHQEVVKDYKKDLIEHLLDIGHERLNGDFLSALAELTSLVNKVGVHDGVHDTERAKWEIIKALGSVDSQHLSLVMHANRIFIHRLRLDKSEDDADKRIASLVMATAKAANEDVKKVDELLDFFDDQLIRRVSVLEHFTDGESYIQYSDSQNAELGRLGGDWRSSIIGLFSHDKNYWESSFGTINPRLDRCNTRFENKQKKSQGLQINNEERCSQCSIS